MSSLMGGFVELKLPSSAWRTFLPWGHIMPLGSNTTCLGGRGEDSVTQYLRRSEVHGLPMPDQTLRGNCWDTDILVAKANPLLLAKQLTTNPECLLLCFFSDRHDAGAFGCAPMLGEGLKPAKTPPAKVWTAPRGKDLMWSSPTTT